MCNYNLEFLHSVIVEAGIAYVIHNNGETFQDVVTGIKAWVEAATVNIGTCFFQLVEDVQHFFITTLTFISSLPHMLLDQGMETLVSP